MVQWSLLASVKRWAWCTGNNTNTSTFIYMRRHFTKDLFGDWHKPSPTPYWCVLSPELYNARVRELPLKALPQINKVLSQIQLVVADVEWTQLRWLSPVLSLLFGSFNTVWMVHRHAGVFVLGIPATTTRGWSGVTVNTRYLAQKQTLSNRNEECVLEREHPPSSLLKVAPGLGHWCCSLTHVSILN